jgi:Tfp pilus assembly pilus retraction ATPase PilT
MPSSIQTGTHTGMQSLEQALRNLVMQGRVDRAHAEGFLQSSASGFSGSLGPAPAAAATAGR